MTFHPIEKDPNYKPWGMELNTFCMLMHLSRFAGAVVPLAGLVMPIVMWATNKDQSDVVDAHGKNILNWIISSVIYAIIGGITFFFVVGIFILIALGICSLIFTIIGAVKANNGEIYTYPLAISFIL
ncbi:MAG: DUF4870 domain-containing protein [Saprospiraceae bacterium]|nr:DUF4870 domain-containing protein [Saprospiraceae bacterium]